jgi:hypothetical protein
MVHQRLEVYYDETLISIVKPTTIQTVLTLVVYRGWPVHQLDVRNAFLHDMLTETFYCSQYASFIDPTHPHCAGSISLSMA